MPIIDILEIGKQGMNANREALSTSSNNIANVNTPGFSRQRAVLGTHHQQLSASVRIPGVELKQVMRIHDQFVRNQILDEAKKYGRVQSNMEHFKRLESVVHNDGFRIGDLLNNFFNDFRELSANPEQGALVTSVRFSAESAATGFRNLNQSLTSMREDLDSQLSIAVGEVNTLAREIAELNGTIAEFRARGEPPLELMDRRDVALRKLSEKVGFQMTRDAKDQVNIIAGGIGVLVNGPETSELSVMRTPAHDQKAEGCMDVFITQGTGVRRVSEHIREGAIGGMLEMRDKVLAPAMTHLDAAAYQFASKVNDLHRMGVGRDGKTGRNLFEPTQSVHGASAMLHLDKEVATNSEAIAVGVEPGLIGDNRIALQIADIQNIPLLTDKPATDLNEAVIDTPRGEKTVFYPAQGRQTLNESLNALVGEIAVQAEHEEQLFKHQEAILGQLDNYERSVSGVNLDEEAISLIQFQAAFNASAKAMKVGDELLETILSIK